MKQMIDKWKKFFVINLAMGIFTFFTTISLKLVNHLDGIWHSAYSVAGNWERGEGRWVWPYVDKLRFGLNTDPFCSVMAIAIIILGNIVVLELLDIAPASMKAYFISFMFLISTSVGVWLTFRYASISFAAPYFFSVLAVFILKRGIPVTRCSNLTTVFIATVCIVLMLGQYQAYLNCTCMLLLAVLLLMLYRNDTKDEIIRFLIRSVFSIVLGGLLYLIGMALINSLYGSTMTGYNGSDSISVTHMISSIPERFIDTFYYFRKFFFGQNFRWNRLQDHTIVVLFFMVVMLAFFVLGAYKTFKKNKVYGVLFVLCTLLMPVAANTALFVAPDAFLSIQMTCGLAFFFPVMMAITIEIQEKEFDKKWAGILLSVVCVVLIYGNYIATQIDQQACKEGQTGTVTLAGEVLDTLLDMGYADNGQEVCFAGLPVGNERFMYSEQFYLANNLMQFGDWGSAASAHKQTWEGIYREYFGYYVKACSEEKFDEIMARDDVAAMPMFPRQGSVKNIDGVIVVKISNKYE